MLAAFRCDWPTLTQLERLRTHSSVMDRVKDERLSPHGWFYAIDTDVVGTHQPPPGTFLPL
jgi:carbonic anhydrase